MTGGTGRGPFLRELLWYAAWLALVVGGYKYVAGVLCGRGNPFLSGNGLWDFVVVFGLSSHFYYLGPSRNWRPAETSAWAILSWNGLCYVLPFFLALHWEYIGSALGVQFSLKGPTSDRLI